MNTNDTFHVVIQHGNGDTNVWERQTWDEMISLQRMALMDPTLVVTVQRDDVSSERLGEINRAKAEVERLVYGEREPVEAECNCGGFDTGRHTAWCQAEPMAGAISQPSGTPCAGRWCQCNVEPAADYNLG